MFDTAASVLFAHTSTEVSSPGYDTLSAESPSPAERGNLIPRQRLTEQGALTEYKIARAHLRDLGIEEALPPGTELDSAVVEREAARGAAFHPDVNSVMVEQWRALAEDAQTWGFRGLSLRAQGLECHPILLGTTSRVVDHIVNAEGVRILIEAVCADIDPVERENKIHSLKRAIEEGPPDGAHSAEDAIMWSSPSNPEELVASIVRSALLAGGDKRRTRVSPELRLWVRDVYAEAGYEPRGVLGGFAAFGSQMALALHYKPTMLSRWQFPSSLYESGLLPKDLPIIADRADCRSIGDIRPEEIVPSAGHYCVSHGNRGSTFLPEELSDLQIHGERVDPSIPHRCEVIVSGSHAEPGFGDRSPDEMREIGRHHRLMCLTGLQYYESMEDANVLFEQLPYAREGGTPVSFEYSEPKAKARPIEMGMLRRLRETNSGDLIAMNTSEAFGLLERILDEYQRGEDLFSLSSEICERITFALEIAKHEETEWGDGREDPRWIAESSQLIQEILDVPFVRVRGMWADVTTAAHDIPIEDPVLVRRALIFSRAQATVKVANGTGAIRSLADQAWVWSTPAGQCLAGIAIINDEIRGRLVQRDLLANSLIENGFARCKDGRMVFLALPTPMLVTDGGTTSAGDAMHIVLATGMLPVLEAAVNARKPRA